MQVTNIIAELTEFDFLIISEDQLFELKQHSNLIIEEITLISDFIRIFEFRDVYIFQEKTPKDEIVIRKFIDKSNANNLLRNRLEIYEKMWNGCGCKINYYSL